MTELKPCPFCGSPGKWRMGGNTDYGVVNCSNPKCDATVFPYLDSKELAYARWNTRSLDLESEEEITARLIVMQYGIDQRVAVRNTIEWLRSRIEKGK